MMLRCDFTIEKETDKAVYVCTHEGYAPNTTRHKWLPKSACKIEVFVQTLNQATNEPETYGKRVVEIESWLAKKIR
jgi:hypothetical protein